MTEQAAASRVRRIPPLAQLSEQQVRGQCCVWCAVRLSNGTAHDLGPRYVRRGGLRIRWFPRSCPEHKEASR
ncbi:hypothetical protein [Streptomyces sp. NRRL S-87]|uniref:hypothetical protein n=1 Tax=Streptomyces sp. NRRL S-87 TaxID=1463920 RepID=UPI00131DC1E2|nr:hypothetical protein [Streptomyces sp. NRRL S-87]